MSFFQGIEGWFAKLLAPPAAPSPQTFAQFHPGGVRFEESDNLVTIVNPLVNVTLRATARVYFDFNPSQAVTVNINPTDYTAGTPAQTSWDRFTSGGRIVGLNVDWVGATPARNGASVSVAINGGVSPGLRSLCSSQLNGLTGRPTLGVFQLEDWAYATMSARWKQTNAAGGKIVVTMTPGAGNSMVVLDGNAFVTGTNGILVEKGTPTSGTTVIYSSVASAASAYASFPNLSVSTTQNATTNSALASGFQYLIVGTDSCVLAETAAGAANDQFSVSMSVLVKGGLPTISTAASTNAADVTLTFGAASFTVI